MIKTIIIIFTMLFCLAGCGDIGVNEEQDTDTTIVNCIDKEIPFDSCQEGKLIEYTGEVTELYTHCEFSYEVTECEFGCIEQEEDDGCDHPCDDFDLSQCTEVDTEEYQDKCKGNDLWLMPPVCILNENKTPECLWGTLDIIECENGCVEDENGAHCQ